MNTLPDAPGEILGKHLTRDIPNKAWKEIIIAMREYAKAYAPVPDSDKVKKLKHALEYLMQGVSGLPPLTAIEGVLIPHYETAKAALEFVAPAAPVPGKEEVYREALDKINKHACKLEDEIWTTDNRTINKRITEIIFQSSQALVSTKQSNESSPL